MTPPPPPRGTLGRLDLRCPPLPQTLVEAVALLEDPDAIEAGAVTAMVERDPMLLVQLLKTVNSAYYGLSRTITSPARAVVLLGPVTVVGLVAGMSLRGLRPLVTASTRVVADRIISHSLATAYLARLIAEELPAAGPLADAPAARRAPAQGGGAYTAGLLHDLGKFVLLYNFPEEATALYRDRALAGSIQADEREHERLLFGCDHTEAGAVAAERSNFPEALVRVVRLHHDEAARRGAGVDAGVGVLLRATAAASRGAALLGYPAGAPRPAPPDADTDEDPEAEEPVWAEVAARDLPGLGGPDAVVARVREEADRLRQYVGSLTQTAPPRTHLRLVK